MKRIVLEDLVIVLMALAIGQEFAQQNDRLAMAIMGGHGCSGRSRGGVGPRMAAVIGSFQRPWSYLIVAHGYGGSRYVVAPVVMMLGATVLLLMNAPVVAHDPYTPFRTEGGRSCCNDRDCRPVEDRFGDVGVEILVEGVWRSILGLHVAGITPPEVDSDYVACWPQGGALPAIRCLLVPPGEV